MGGAAMSYAQPFGQKDNRPKKSVGEVFVSPSLGYWAEERGMSLPPPLPDANATRKRVWNENAMQMRNANRRFFPPTKNALYCHIFSSQSVTKVGKIGEQKQTPIYFRSSSDQLGFKRHLFLDMTRQQSPIYPGGPPPTPPLTCCLRWHYYDSGGWKMTDSYQHSSFPPYWWLSRLLLTARQTSRDRERDTRLIALNTQTNHTSKIFFIF